ncbi:hypothetical protein BDP27DRAFT_1423871 [Rhodocollybia butyracea]|uniref:DNA mismatch repair protein MutL n=1 Tax=Rhodocollybia butyracea TaxID=206335 RepID=A0A9P5U511_9AGAR|nr:hypothetical protein BDP27DRAFT_1423871 [Rhodocollybia butyracea]
MSISQTSTGGIKAIDSSSVHRITSGQVVVDLQTAVKELVENSLDAGATSIEIRFKNFGLKSIEVVDNGSGISEADFDSIGRKHHTSKLSAFHDLTTLTSFGFRGEALSSLCALCETVTVTTATVDKAPMGAVLELDKRGEPKSRGKGVRQRGTTVLLVSPFAPLPVRRKELERNIKREFGKALTLLNAYALGPCCGLGVDLTRKAVRLSVTNQPEKGAKTTHISLPLSTSNGSTPSLRTVRAGTTALWGSKALDGVIDLELEFDVPKIKAKVKGRKSKANDEDEVEETFKISVQGLISSPTPTPGSGSTPRPGTAGRTATDRQFFYVNGRPCTMNKIQKAINETYRSFLPSNSTSGQFPFIIIDFSIPGDAVDVNVTPDKRTILVHAEAELCTRMKDALEKLFALSRSTYGVNDMRLLPKSASLDSRPSNQGSQAMTRSASVGVSLGRGTQENDVDELADDSGKEQEVMGPPRSISKRLSLPAHVTSMSAEQTVHRPIPTASLSDSMDADENGSMVIDGPISHQPISDRSSPEPPALPPVKKPHAPLVPPIVLDTSSASWQGPKNSFGRPVDLNFATMDSGPVSGNAVTPAGASKDGEDEQDMEPPRKKRKSALTTSDDDRAVDSDEERERPQNRKGQNNILQSSAVRDNLSSGGTRIRTVSNPQQAKLTDLFKSKTTRKELRSQLAGFARSGSKVMHKSSDTEEEELEDDQNDGRILVDGKRAQSPSAPTATQKPAQSLFLPEEEEDNSMVVDTSDDLLDAPSSGNTLDNSASSTISLSTHLTTPPGSSSVLNSNPDKASELLDLTLDDDDDSPILLLSSDKTDQPEAQDGTLHRPEVIRTQASQSSDGDVHLRFDLSGISQRWSKLHSLLQDAQADCASHNQQRKVSESRLTTEAGISTADAKASEVALSRVISKEDFGEMEVLGQFNLGFIIVRRRKRGGAPEEDTTEAPQDLDDLFIQTTSIKSQKLFKPRTLELTASDELIALENMDILRLNGFELGIIGGSHEDDDDVEMLETDESQQNRANRKLNLVAQPVSKSTVFDMRDLEELIQMMHDHPTGQMVRCSKARAMFASRACRKSVMIGMPLTKGQMSTVVAHMGTMDQPWNCPHGRPTMRHLFDMANIQPSRNNKARRDVNWAEFT